MPSLTSPSFTAVYGPVHSWRYGRSLGIDPIGSVSTCSFDCVYCQLGEIVQKVSDRQLFIPTTQILHDLQAFAPWDVDAITLSGSGEPTLAMNLPEIIQGVKDLTHKPVGVLTNGTLLADPTVQRDLAIADQVAVKLDAVTPDQLRRVNRPVQAMDLAQQWVGFEQFRQQYHGQFAIQTMILTPWTEAEQTTYISLMQRLQPNEIQLNSPTRARPLTHQLDARGNELPTDVYPVRSLKLVSQEVLIDFAERIQQQTGISVRYPVVE